MTAFIAIAPILLAVTVGPLIMFVWTRRNKNTLPAGLIAIVGLVLAAVFFARVLVEALTQQSASPANILCLCAFAYVAYAGFARHSRRKRAAK